MKALFPTLGYNLFKSFRLHNQDKVNKLSWGTLQPTCLINFCGKKEQITTLK